MLTVDITPYKSGIHQIELEPTAEEVDLAPDAFDDLHVDATLTCHRDRILVELEASAVAELTCDRTLKPFDQRVEGTYRLLFGPASMVGDESDAYEEVRPLDRTDLEIDLTDVVRDTILLAIPQRCIAPGAEEEDIDMTFGTSGEEEGDDEGPVDPRWSELKKLKDE